MKKLLEDTPFLVVDLNSGRYIIEQDGHELFNLEQNKIDNRYYGYCPPHDGVNIQKLGAKHRAQSIDNVMVIYVRKLPDSNNRQIIAFSDNVTAYKTKQSNPSLKRYIKTNGKIIDCSFSIESDYMYDLRDYKKKFIINIAEYNTYMFRRQRFYRGTYPRLDEGIVRYLKEYLNPVEFDESTIFQEEVQIVEANALASDSKEKPSYTTGANGRQIAKKSRIAKAALANAEFKCASNDKHTTFRTTRGNVYMEGHHLIPCTCKNSDYFWDNFKINIDCVENIVSLCPTCHRLVHFGSEKERYELLKKLYDYQIKNLQEIGIDISLDELIKRYEY